MGISQKGSKEGTPTKPGYSISQMEDDVHVRREFASNVLRHFNRSERCTSAVNIIKAVESLEYYINLWYNKNVKDASASVMKLKVWT